MAGPSVMARYRKTIAAVVAGLIGWGGVVIVSTPAAPTAAEWLQLGVSLAVALGVYAAPNDTPEGELPDPAVSERG